MSYPLVVYSGQLGWPTLFWQPSTVYLSFIYVYMFAQLLWKIFLSDSLYRRRKKCSTENTVRASNRYH